MVRTNSTMLQLGTELPAFNLEVVKGTNINCLPEHRGLQFISKNILSDKPVLIMVICAHCPFVKHIEQGLKNLDNDYGHKVQILAISSNSLITHPQDGPEYLAEQSNKNSWNFPYLLDPHQNFAKALNAACTPDFFLFSSRNDESSPSLKYRGQLDESRPGNSSPVTGRDLRMALEDVLSGKDPFQDQKPSIGCNIKWDPGKEPDWFG